MKRVVPDASVLLKWVLPSDDEKDSELALRLRDDALNGRVELLVPALWIYEVGNTLARRFPSHARELLGALVQFQMYEAEPTDVWRDTALDLTRRFKVTFYDAAYHALAVVESGVLVTADKKYVAKAGTVGDVVLLADIDDNIFNR